MGDLSASFSLSEFLQSQKAAEHNIEINPSEQDVVNLQALCVAALQPLRSGAGGLDGVGRLRVTSGLRNTELNRLVGGSRTSQHTLCALRGGAHSAAADVSPVNTDAGVGWQRLLALLNAGAVEVDQAIYYPQESRYHISYIQPDCPSGDKNRTELLVALKNPLYKQGGKAPKHKYTGWSAWCEARQLDEKTGKPIPR